MNKTIKSVLEDSLKLVDNKNVFYRDILFLIEDIFNLSEMDILAKPNLEVNDGLFREKLTRLVDGEPVEYIVGKAPFYGNTFKVNKFTLIPRNETEELIEITLDYIKKLGLKDLHIIDIGSGSGCIAITLNKLLECNVDSVDISNEALDVAKENNKLLKTNVNFYNSDCLDGPIKMNKKYNVIISNPPYIDRDTFVQESVLKYEPHSALFADNHGLSIYEKIFKEAKDVLIEHSLLTFEISPDLVEGLKVLHDKYLNDYSFEFKLDMNKFVRFMILYKK